MNNHNYLHPSRAIFILDVSSSMSYKGKLRTLELSVKRHISDLPLGSHVGIVYFSATAFTVHPVVQINNESVRERLINSLPKMTETYTDIGAGILEALAEIKRSGLISENASFVLATDGEQTLSDPVFGYNYVARVMPHVLAAQVRFICLAIGKDADPNLETLTRATKGRTHSTSPCVRAFWESDGSFGIPVAVKRHKALESRAMGEAFRQSSGVRDPDLDSLDSFSTQSSPYSQSPLYSPHSPVDHNYCYSILSPTTICQTINVCNDLLELSEGLNEIKVIIDSDIGRNTNFIVESEEVDMLSGSILSPNEVETELSLNSTLKSFRSTMAFMETGVWTVRLKSKSEDLVLATLLVSSQPMTLDSIPIRMNVIIKEAETDSPPIIASKLCKGIEAVIGAEVTATVDRPNGTQSTVKLINYNNIYCNYFTDYCGSGRYNVTVLAKSNDTTTRLKNLTLLQPESDLQTVEPFQRQQIVGSFKIDGSITFSKPVSDQKLQELSISQAFVGLTMNTPPSQQ